MNKAVLLFFRRVLSGIKSVPRKTWLNLGIVFFAYVISVVTFVALADEVMEGDPLPFDEPIMRFVHSLSTPLLDSIVVVTTDLGYLWWIGGASLVLFVWLIMRRRYRDGVFVVVAIGGAAVVNLLLKAFFQRDRPELWERLITETSASFPSGHAMAASAFAVTLVLLAWPTRYRWLTVSLGALYAFYIAWTRVYLGVHYPSDVFAGWAASIIWVLTVALLLYGKRRHWAIWEKTLG